jgi:hypothetical protein
MGKWVMIVRLEKWIPAQLDELTRRRLLNELFTNWLQQQLNPSVSSPHIKDVED